MKFLIAGLGNTGEAYSATRHNIGFDIADAVAEQAGVEFELGRHALTANFKYRGKHLHLIKPTTHMNHSGKAIRYWLRALKIPIENLFVIVDDISLPLGKIRIRASGSDGGHNGLLSIMQMLETKNFARLRFGIGDEFPKGQQVNYVLGEWDKKELEVLPELVENATKAIKSFCMVGIERTMNLYN